VHANSNTAACSQGSRCPHEELTSHAMHWRSQVSTGRLLVQLLSLAPLIELKLLGENAGDPVLLLERAIMWLGWPSAPTAFSGVLNPIPVWARESFDWFLCRGWTNEQCLTGAHISQLALPSTSQLGCSYFSTVPEQSAQKLS
jgi:hypothetical protein